MISPPEPTSMQLLEAYRKGDERAAARLFDRYSERLIALARSKISLRLAGKVDPEAAMISAFGSFFLGARDGRYTLQCSGDLWKLLSQITVRKVLRQVKYHTAARRDVNREQAGIEEVELSAEDPSPDHAAMFADELQLLFAALPAIHQQMVKLYLQGRTPVEIAEQMGYTAVRVRQVLNKVRAWAKERMEQLEGGS